MRIAFVSSETAHHRDTETNRRFQTVFDLVESRGHDVHVFCARFWSGGGSTLERNGITYHAVSAALDARRSSLLRVPFAVAAARPDVVHANARRPKHVLAASLGAMFARVPFIVEWDGDGVDTETRWTRSAVHRPDRILTPSELVGTTVRELGVDSNAVETIPNAIDLERITAVQPSERVDVVYARHLDEDANLESLLLALAELRQRTWRATVIGDGPERDTYERLASDLRIADRITFAGDRSLEERIAAYRGAHVFVQTADRCAFPTELLWAVASGCVGIVEYRTNSSAHELVEGWDRGFRTTSEQELADAILAAGDLEHRDFDETFADYDRTAIADQYLQQYRTLQDEYGLR